MKGYRNDLVTLGTIRPAHPLDEEEREAVRRYRAKDKLRPLGWGDVLELAGVICCQDPLARVKEAEYRARQIVTKVLANRICAIDMQAE